MHKNNKLTMKCSYFKEIIANAQNLADNPTTFLRRKLPLSKLEKAIWNSNAKSSLQKSLRAELNILIQIISADTIKWLSPIAQL